MILICNSSDAQDRLPVGKAWELKLTQLDDETLAYQGADGAQLRYTRKAPNATADEKAHAKEFAAIQGTWVPLQYEEKDGTKVEGNFNFRQIIEGDKVTFQVDGKTRAEGKVVLDVTKSPKRLDFRFTSGQNDLIIYVRTGDYVIYCGNRDGKTRPTEFGCGTSTGGDYLQVWRIER